MNGRRKIPEGGRILTELKQESGVSTAITVRRARHSDYPKIAIFIREAYGKLARFKAKDRWDWQFVENPFTFSEDDRVPVWIAETSGKVIGQIAVQMGALEIDGTLLSAGWIVDVIVLPPYRGLGLGHRLYDAVASECPILVTLTMAPATRRLAERLGAIDLGNVQLYWRGVLLDGNTVRRYLVARTFYHPRVKWIVRTLCRYFLVHRILARLGNLLALRNALVRRPIGRQDVRIIETHPFDPDIGGLWQSMRDQFPIAFTRETEFMEWRFGRCPQMKYRCFVAWRQEKPVGYVILRRTEPIELREGVIVDLLAARQDRDTIRDLIAFAIDFFGNKVAAIQCATSIPEFANVLRSFGFHKVRTERPNCVVADQKVREVLEKRPGDWLFSKADHDWDQVHLA